MRGGAKGRIAAFPTVDEEPISRRAQEPQVALTVASSEGRRPPDPVLHGCRLSFAVRDWLQKLAEIASVWADGALHAEYAMRVNTVQFREWGHDRGCGCCDNPHLPTVPVKAPDQIANFGSEGD